MNTNPYMRNQMTREDYEGVARFEAWMAEQDILKESMTFEIKPREKLPVSRGRKEQQMALFNEC